MSEYKGRCAHFNGVDGTDSKACAAGICYRSLAGGPVQGWLGRLPCLPSFRETARTLGTETVRCDSFRARTEAEKQAERDEEAYMIARGEAIGKLCDDIKRKSKPGSRGECECPVCSGIMKWSRAVGNGHMRARCSTPGCLSLIE